MLKIEIFRHTKVTILPFKTFESVLTAKRRITDNPSYRVDAHWSRESSLEFPEDYLK